MIEKKLSDTLKQKRTIEPDNIKRIGYLDSLTELTQRQLNTIKRVYDEPFDSIDTYRKWYIEEVFPYAIGHLARDNYFKDVRLYVFLIESKWKNIRHYREALWMPIRDLFVDLLVSLFNDVNDDFNAMEQLQEEEEVKKDWTDL